MTRSNIREIALHMIFELGFSQSGAQDLLAEYLTKERFAEIGQEIPLYDDYPSKKQEVYLRKLVEGTFSHSPELDGYIAQYSKGWHFARIPRVAAAMMRIAMYEILYMPEIPNPSAINDALEIAKHYEDPDVISFMNGILGSFVRAEFADTPAKPEKKVPPQASENQEEDPEETGQESGETFEEESGEILSMTLEKAPKPPATDPLPTEETPLPVAPPLPEETP